MGLGVKTKMNTKMRGRKRKHDQTSDLDSDASMDFMKFPSTTQAQSLPAPFRDRIKEFLSSQPVQPVASFPAFTAWRVPLRLCLPDGSQVPLPLHVVEEDVTASSRSLYCDHCRVVGWSGHPVCRKRYHIIVKREEVSISESESEIDVTTTTLSMLEDNRHLLHAIVHSNGFGHLLTLNGRHGGSPHLSGRHLIHFWDRLSLSLSLRKVSVMDLSKKHGTEYRLLHAVARGCSWYGIWGYEFGSGSYALTSNSYRQALLSLSATPLSPFLLPGSGTSRSRLASVISLYRALSLDELDTFADLFLFLLDLVPSGTHDREPPPSGVLCVWTKGDVERLQQATVKVLRVAAASSSSGGGWVPRRALKGTLCKSAASLQLLDYCLKHLGGAVTPDGSVVQSRCNPASAAIEYRLEPLSCSSDNVDSIYPSAEQVLCDLKFLYDSLLNPDTAVNDIPQALREQVVDSATKLLDCKQFVKAYYAPEQSGGVESPDEIRLWCDVQLLDQPKSEVIMIPPELVVLPSNATVGDLKRVATQAFREVYVMLKKFQAEALAEFVGSATVDDSMTLKFLVGSSGLVRLSGRCGSKHGLGRFRMERGVESWTVRCLCGAKDDDGERMVACDACSVWQHTRCVGIANSDAIPAEFVCSRCLYLCPDDGSGEEDLFSVSLSDSTCRAKVAAFGGLGLTANLAIGSDVR